MMKLISMTRSFPNTHFLRLMRTKQGYWSVPTLVGIALALMLVTATLVARFPVFAETAFVVNSTGDGPDTNLTDDVCDSDAEVEGEQCTLRAAIEQANYTAGLDRINFAIGSGVQTISPASALPILTDPVVIDGTTQPGFDGQPIIELLGRNLDSVSGLMITAGSSTVRGLVINGFGGAPTYENGYRNSYGVLLEVNGGNTIAGNFIGTDVTGTTRQDNSNNIGIGIIDVPNNTIGGTTPGERNVITGNLRNNVSIEGTAATDNIIQGNFIGVDATGTKTIITSFSSIALGASNNMIGGTTPGARNIIAGSYSNGISIYGSGNIVQGNYIGTDAQGETALRNEEAGIVISSSSGNIVGGASPGAGNLISGNGVGVKIEGEQSSSNIVQGNFIGTDRTGTRAVPNSSGVRIGGKDNVIGGSTAEARNIISGNRIDGVTVGGNYNRTSNNMVQGNYIGVNVSGTIALGNGVGVNIQEATGNLIGGTLSGTGNVISGNNGFGIAIGQFGITAAQNFVQGNLIGTDASGKVAVGNGKSGVYICNGGMNIIGGAIVDARNIISANHDNGIQIEGCSGSSVSSNHIIGNFIGTDISGLEALGNAKNGISLTYRVFNTKIGGTLVDEVNTIAYNGGVGVSIGRDVDSQADISNIGILRNIVHSNGGLGIDLDGSGPQVNDLGDADAGANNRQNYPDLSAVTSRDGTTTITGTLNSTADISFRLEFFANRTCDASGYGEGERFLGFVDVATNGSGDSAFIATLQATLGGGETVTATATDPNNNTSEFGPCLGVGQVPPTRTPTTTATVSSSATATATVFRTAMPTSVTCTAIPMTPTSTTTATATPTTTTITTLYLPLVHAGCTTPMATVEPTATVTNTQTTTATGTIVPTATAGTPTATSTTTDVTATVTATTTSGAMTMTATGTPATVTMTVTGTATTATNTATGTIVGSPTSASTPTRTGTPQVSSPTITPTTTASPTGSATSTATSLVP